MQTVHWLVWAFKLHKGLLIDERTHKWGQTRPQHNILPIGNTERVIKFPKGKTYFLWRSNHLHFQRTLHVWHLKAAVSYFKSGATNILGYIAELSPMAPRLAVRERFSILLNPCARFQWVMIAPLTYSPNDMLQALWWTSDKVWKFLGLLRINH